MRIRLGLLGLAALGFALAVIAHLVALFVVDAQVATYLLDHDFPLYYIGWSLFLFATATYAAMTDGVIWVGNIGCLGTIFGAIMRTPPSLMKALGLYVVYALLTSLIVQAPHPDLQNLRAMLLLAGLLNLLAVGVLVGRLLADDPQWNPFTATSRKRMPMPRSRVPKK